MIALLALLGRLLIVASLLAPHGARAETGGLTLVICGAEGAYEIALPGVPPAPHSDRHDCCLGLCALLVAPTPSLPVCAATALRIAPPLRAADPLLASAVLPPPARGPPARI